MPSMQERHAGDAHTTVRLAPFQSYLTAPWRSATTEMLQSGPNPAYNGPTDNHADS